MISEYEQQANDFLRRNDVKINMRLIGVEQNPMWKDKYSRNHYAVTITTPLGQMETEFWDSIANTEKNSFVANSFVYKRPTAYDILACLEKYDPGDFDDFFEEFGYTKPSQAWKVYQAVKTQVADLQRIFTEKQLEELAEIN